MWGREEKDRDNTLEEFEGSSGEDSSWVLNRMAELLPCDQVCERDGLFELAGHDHRAEARLPLEVSAALRVVVQPDQQMPLEKAVPGRSLRTGHCIASAQMHEPRTDLVSKGYGTASKDAGARVSWASKPCVLAARSSKGRSGHREGRGRVKGQWKCAYSWPPHTLSVPDSAERCHGRRRCAVPLVLQ